MKFLRWLFGTRNIKVGYIYKNSSNVYVIVDDINKDEVKYRLYYKGYGRSTSTYFLDKDTFLERYSLVS